MWAKSDSEKVKNKWVSNHSSKGSSSRETHFTRHDLDLYRGRELAEMSWLSCLLRILRIRLGFSNTSGGYGSGLDLV